MRDTCACCLVVTVFQFPWPKLLAIAAVSLLTSVCSIVLTLMWERTSGAFRGVCAVLLSRMEALSDLHAHICACKRMPSTSVHEYIYLALTTGCVIILLHKNQLLRWLASPSLLRFGTRVAPHLHQLRSAAHAYTGILSSTFTARVTAGSLSPSALL
jgi:hypothetical protein